MVLTAFGNLSLLITEEVSWESFREQAPGFVNRFGGIELKRIDTPVERIRIVLIKWHPFWLTFEDFPLGRSLDSMIRFFNSVIRDLYRNY